MYLRLIKWAVKRFAARGLKDGMTPNETVTCVHATLDAVIREALEEVAKATRAKA